MLCTKSYHTYLFYAMEYIVLNSTILCILYITSEKKCVFPPGHFSFWYTEVEDLNTL
jgi:hypothetical protein